jgi:hypothetical protein
MKATEFSPMVMPKIPSKKTPVTEQEMPNTDTGYHDDGWTRYNWATDMHRSINSPLWQASLRGD